ncbi:type II toxin-antitoxin system RelE/ParE family toxin [Petrocella sp. FN5]|uniref:type II toxin-antitoxin system RelE/ParE family toxin n=1 Tax=Petrocella sp. FN5 TaxID=3032002 RepID=UPI0023D9B667|nr:type II toxin-antitoxin system RelE/ParE family toxin [Petrocella sp. FN5]MDF1616508.1 type II toxin-antitoxin system RelE/ParE family toxin [Petrocella sp. FN5]
MSLSFNVIYKESAMNDTYAILDYISRDNPNAAEKFIQKITDRIGNLSQFPFLGTLPNEFELRKKGYRMLLIDSYIVFYIPVQALNEVRIHRILSSKQNYSTFL